MTRVATFMMGREITGRTYAEIGVPDAHHPISHHQRDPVKLEKLLKINEYHVTFFAEFLERLKNAEDENGSLLDSSTIVYGAGMADSNSHLLERSPHFTGWRCSSRVTICNTLRNAAQQPSS